MIVAFGIGDRSVNVIRSPINLGIIIQVMIMAVLVLVVISNLRILRDVKGNETSSAFRFVNLAKALGVIGLLAGACLSVLGVILMCNTVASEAGTPNPARLADAISIKLTPLFWGLLTAIFAFTSAGIMEFLIARKIAKR